MKSYLMRSGFLSIICGAAALGFAQLSVTSTNDGNTLANAGLGSLPAGVQVTGVSYSGANGASGTYSNLTFGPLSSISSGLLMTTGDAQLAVGPNDQDGAGVDNGGPTATFTNYDGKNSIDLNNVVTLAINFSVQTATSLSFDFSYGSEEYWYYTNSQFNDSFFAFLDNNPKTLALDSLGNAITVDNQFLTIDNRPSTFDPTNGFGLPDKTGTGTAAGINELQYDGFTPVLKTNFDVSAGNHTLTFVIGDAGDGVLDSGVFISHIFGPGTSGGGTNPVPEPGTLAFMALGSAGMFWGAARRRIATVLNR